MTLALLAAAWLAGLLVGLRYSADPWPVFLLALATVPVAFLLRIYGRSPGILMADFAPQTSVGSVDPSSRRGGTPSLFKDQTLSPASAKVGQPVSNGMRLSVQSLSHLDSRPPLGQQP